MGVTAREAGVGAIRYESVRDPGNGGCCAVLSWQAFARPAPARAQTWTLTVTTTRVTWQRTDSVLPQEHEFVVDGLWRH